MILPVSSRMGWRNWRGLPVVLVRVSGGDGGVGHAGWNQSRSALMGVLPSVRATPMPSGRVSRRCRRDRRRFICSRRALVVGVHPDDVRLASEIFQGEDEVVIPVLDGIGGGAGLGGEFRARAAVPRRRRRASQGREGRRR